MIGEDICISAPGERYNRFQVAIEIQDACNPSGVARELVRVIKDAMDDPECTGTNWVCLDSAVRLVVNKLMSMTYADANDLWSKTYEEAEQKRCTKAARMDGLIM